MEIFKGRSVKELQNFLKTRGVTFSKERKAGLTLLCEKALNLNIEVDPDGLCEDREDVLREKLTFGGDMIQCPTVLNDYSNNIAILPLLCIIDIYNYLHSYEENEYSTANFRDYHKMEGYTMAKDGLVVDMCFSRYPDVQEFIGIKSQVKPRTKDKDPKTKLSYYNL